MKKKWDYAEWAKKAKETGGPEAYSKMLQKYGFRRGVWVMIPVCIASCVATYKKGTQIVGFVKDKFAIVTKKDATYEENQLEKKENTTFIECPLCGRKAFDIDEINVIFGFAKNELGELEVNSCCKQCIQN